MDFDCDWKEHGKEQSVLPGFHLVVGGSIDSLATMAKGQLRVDLRQRDTVEFFFVSGVGARLAVFRATGLGYTAGTGIHVCLSIIPIR